MDDGYVAAAAPRLDEHPGSQTEDPTLDLIWTEGRIADQLDIRSQFEIAAHLETAEQFGSKLVTQA